MKNFKIRTRLEVRADNADEAVRKGLRILAEFPHLPVVVSTFMTGTEKVSSSVFTRDGTQYGTTHTPLTMGFGDANTGDAQYDLMTEFWVQEAGHKDAARSAFEMLTNGDQFQVRVSERFAETEYKPVGVFTAEAVALAGPML